MILLAWQLIRLRYLKKNRSEIKIMLFIFQSANDRPIVHKISDTRYTGNLLGLKSAVNQQSLVIHFERQYTFM